MNSGWPARRGTHKVIMSNPTDKYTEFLRSLKEFNDLLDADPFHRAIKNGVSWGDVNDAYEAQSKASQASKPKVCPWAPKKAKRERV